MRLKVVKTKNYRILYIIKTIYVDGKEKSVTVEKLGRFCDLKEQLNGEDPIEWGRKYAAELTEKEKQGKQEIILKYSPCKTLEKNEQQLFNGGYLFLQKIYHELGLHKISKKIAQNYKFDFDLNSVLSRLIYGRIIYPGSKLSTNEACKRFMEKPNFELQHIYRSLDFLAKESDFIQSSLYANSLESNKRNTGILYYDCTNFFFEIEQADSDGLRKYGFSKEHRPNPIVQMGLFMDGDGIPLAFNINRGNTNEQTTLKPIEEKILSDFNLSKFVVCTDAGLASTSNRKYNTLGERAFVTTQSIKKLKKHLKEWALSHDGWSLTNSKKVYNISNLDELLNEADANEKNDLINKIFFKERWIKENGLEQKLIVTFSLKYRDYQRRIRTSQVERAQKMIDSNPGKIGKPKPNDCKRFIEKTTTTKDGEVADKNFFTINLDLVAKEQIFDGFYGVCTNLEDAPTEIIKVNKRRWEIEECFRIMKSEFKSRPVFLSREDRIIAHFTTCFISLIIYRLLEKKLDHKYTCSEIISGLKDMNFLEVKGEGYIPAYTRNDFTDDLHNAFGFRTDHQILNKTNIKNIFKETKI